MLHQAPLFQFRHGDHVCVFYRTEDALMEILTPYICEGLRNGERCFCVQSNEVVRRLDYDLRYLGVNVEREVKRGALQFYTENDVYFATGKFDPSYTGAGAQPLSRPGRGAALPRQPDDL